MASRPEIEIKMVGYNRPRIAKVMGIKDLRIGGTIGTYEARKRRYEIHQGRRGPFSYFVKEFIRVPQDNFMEIITATSVARREGFPVPPTSRYFVSPDGQMSQLMTDMTYGGRYDIWGYNDRSKHHEQKILRSMHISEADIGTIDHLTGNICALADVHHRIVGFQTYHVRRDHLSGMLDIVLLDLDYRFLNSHGFREVTYTNQMERADFMNRLYTAR